MAVKPIAVPVSNLRRKASGIAACSGEAGDSSSKVNNPAETMNMPNAQASMKYSGQCAAGLCFATVAGVLTGSTSGFEARVESHSAVDEQADTVHVVGVVRCQPHGRAADFVGFADALVGNEPQQLAVGLRGPPRFHVDGRADGARTDAVHADTIRRYFLRQALHHQHDPAFRGGIVHVTSPRNHLVHRADAENFAGRAGHIGLYPPAFEFPDGLARAEELTREIHAENLVP